MCFAGLETQIHVEGLEVVAHVGHGAAERSVPQIVIVDIECTLSISGIYNDELSQTVDYVPIVTAVRALACAHPRSLIETLAEEIAEACFANPRVRMARIRVRKPHKLAGCHYVGTVRTFERRT